MKKGTAYKFLDFFIEKRYALRKRITPDWNVKFSVYCNKKKNITTLEKVVDIMSATFLFFFQKSFKKVLTLYALRGII